jgi:alginate O-acetyltransferase complex protein AlgI
VAGHTYALLVTLVSWVFFRATSLGHATGILSAMVGFNHPTGLADGIATFIDPFALTMLVAGMVGAFPLMQRLQLREPIPSLGYATILFAVLVMVAVKTFTPFIYQQF